MRFEPGKYYVGDLCYVLGDRWDEFCELTIKPSDKGMECLDGGFIMKDGTRFWQHCTMYGDGTYRDTQGRKYAVDAGLIGVVSVDQIDKEPSYLEGGQIIEFKNSFEPYYKEGVFHIGYSHFHADGVVINTSGSNEPMYDEDEEYEDE